MADLCTPLRSGNDLYLYDTSGSVYALAADTGSATWKADPGIPLNEGVMLSGDAVLVAGQTKSNGAVIALDRLSGRQLWRRDTAGQVGAHLGPRPGSVLVHDADGVLLLLDAATGQVVWRSAFVSDAFHLFNVGRLAVGDSVVLETFGGTLRADMGDPITHPNTEWFRAVDGADGRPKWTADVAAANWTVVPHAGGGRPGTSGLVDWLSTEVTGFAHVVRTILSPSGDPDFALSTTSELVGIDVQTGKSGWSFSAGMMSRPVVKEDAIYVASAETPEDPMRIHGWDARTGREIWTFAPSGDDAEIVNSGVSLAVDGDVLCAGSGYGILALDVRTGTRVWSVHDGAQSLGGTPVAWRDVVYMTTRSGTAGIRSWRVSDGMERPAAGPQGERPLLFLADDMLLLRTGDALRAIPFRS
jgi:outer membrane protein assembly factor BamB